MRLVIIIEIILINLAAVVLVVAVFYMLQVSTKFLVLFKMIKMNE